MAHLWLLPDEVNLRPEAFGGMAFHRQRGITLEVDTEAYRFLSAYREPRSLPPASYPAARLVPQLVRLGFLCLADRATPASCLQGGTDAATPEPARDQPVEWAGGCTLSAPETVHLAITARCNQACPGCYVPRTNGGSELPIAEWRGLVDQWAQMHVFQLAVGGGEPLLYDGLVNVLGYARQRGIVPNLTTNGALLDAVTVRELERAGVARVNLSWNGPADDADKPSSSLSRALPLLLDSAVRVGINLLVTPALLSRLPGVLVQLRAQGVRQVTILRPKPPAFPTRASRAWYDAHRLRRADLVALRDVLRAWQGTLDLEVDSALACLMGDAAPAHLRWRGVQGCAAGRRICAVWPDGQVTPCSFLADLSAGNVRQAPFADLWARGESWERLRDAKTRPGGACIDCAIASQCGGALCVARYESAYEAGKLFAGEPECPGIA